MNDSKKIVLVATPEKLRTLVIDSEISDHVHAIADAEMFSLSSLTLGPFASVVAKVGRYAYSKYRESDVDKLSEEELLRIIEKELMLGYKIHLVHPEEVDKQLCFGVKPIVEDGAIYFEHPIYSGMYVSPARYSSTLCSEKESAFLRLGAALGAKTIKLESINSTEKKTWLGGDLTAKEVAGELGFSANFDKSGNLVKGVYKEFHRPQFSTLKIPKDLEEWIRYDPDLRTMAADRIEANAKMAKIRLEFSERVTFGLEVAGKLVTRGFSIGGDVKTINRSIWSFEVEYFDMSECGV